MQPSKTDILSPNFSSSVGRHIWTTSFSFLPGPLPISKSTTYTLAYHHPHYLLPWPSRKNGKNRSNILEPKRQTTNPYSTPSHHKPANTQQIFWKVMLVKKGSQQEVQTGSISGNVGGEDEAVMAQMGKKQQLEVGLYPSRWLASSRTSDSMFFGSSIRGW